MDGSMDGWKSWMMGDRWGFWVWFVEVGGWGCCTGGWRKGKRGRRVGCDMRWSKWLVGCVYGSDIRRKRERGREKLIGCYKMSLKRFLCIREILRKVSIQDL